MHTMDCVRYPSFKACNCGKRYDPITSMIILIHKTHTHTQYVQQMLVSSHCLVLIDPTLHELWYCHNTQALPHTLVRISAVLTHLRQKNEGGRGGRERIIGSFSAWSSRKRTNNSFLSVFQFSLCIVYHELMIVLYLWSDCAVFLYSTLKSSPWTVPPFCTHILIQWTHMGRKERGREGGVKRGGSGRGNGK